MNDATNEEVVEFPTTREAPTDIETASSLTVEEVEIVLDEKLKILSENQVDYTSDYDAINVQLERLIELSEINIETQNTLIEAMNYVITYCVVLIPLIIIIMGLWWFFKQFIYMRL